MDPVTLIKKIISIGIIIYGQYELVNANRTQCKRLIDRIKIITNSLQGLEQIPDSAQFKAALESMCQWMEKCHTFIKQFSSKKYYQVWLKAGTYREQFQALYDGLEPLIGQLNLGISVQQIINREKDREDQQADSEEFKRRQEELFNLAEAEFREMQAIRSNQESLDRVVRQQLESLRTHLAELGIDGLRRDLPRSPIDAKQMVKYCDITFEAEIGRGSFGIIYKAVWSGQPVAVKTVQGKMTQRDKQEFIREVQIMSRLHCQNVVQFYGACLEDIRESLLMEYMERGSLTHVLETKQLTVEEQGSIAKDVAIGLSYLHCRGVIHRDLKSSNVLLDDLGRAKITDFGLSDISSDSILRVAGTSQAIFWMAPEVLLRQPHTEQSDIYGYGVVLWEIVTNRKPLASSGAEAVSEIILTGRRVQTDPIPDYVSDEYRDLIIRCWSVDPAKRPTLADIIRIVSESSPRKALPVDLYEKGVACEKHRDLVTARLFYEQAYKAGYVRAATNLATFFRKGSGGVAQDKAYAYQLLQQSAAAGHGRAQYNLALMLEQGDGVPQDLAEAHKWYEKASQQGDSRASRRLTGLTTRLAAETSSAAQQRVLEM